MGLLSEYHHPILVSMDLYLSIITIDILFVGFVIITTIDTSMNLLLLCITTMDWYLWVFDN